MLYFARWKIIVILAVCIFGMLTAFPNLLPEERAQRLPDFLPQQQINLGLDLQGGSHLLLEVKVAEVFAERLENLVDEVRRTLREARIGYTGGPRVENGAVRVRILDEERLGEAVELLRELASPVSTGLISSGEADLTVTAEDGRWVEVRMSEAAISARRSQVVSESIEIVRRRIDELGTVDPSIQREGSERIILQVPGVENPDDILDIIRTEARLTFHMVDERVSPAEARAGRIPAGSELVDMVTAAEGLAPEQIVIRKRADLTGDMLTDAQPTYDQNNQPVVQFKFDTRGARIFAQLTKENVGKRFAVKLDDEIITAPVIRTPILGGTGIIQGGFTVESAGDLALLLRAGALPAPIEVLERRSVGPDLGADSIRAGKNAAIIGLSAVVIFIILSYGFFGVAANIALFVNICLILGILSVLQATLTLPGIAGIVLTMGMAVDANVLVFERIREEVASGKKPVNAIDVGYQKAFSTILDANITTFIAAFILFFIGSGPVRGFAVTLMIGIFTSVFTAVAVTRLMLATWLRKRRPATITV